MTTGHEHRIAHVESFDAWYVQLLRIPLLHFDVRDPKQLAKVEMSPYPYGPCPMGNVEKPTCWVLTPLSILHRWTGLTLCNNPRPCPDHDPVADLNHDDRT